MTAVAYTAEGTYVKNGGCVSFICFIQFTNKGSGSAADGMTIEGFPTTQTSTLTQMRGGGTVVYENFTGITGMVQAQVLGDATPYMYLYECGGAGATAISRGSLTNTGYFYVSGQYFTDE
jgi:hypothetical protein